MNRRVYNVGSKFHMPSSNYSVLIAIKFRATENVLMAVMLFYIRKNYCFGIKNAYFSYLCCHTPFQDPKSSVASSLQVRVYY